MRNRPMEKLEIEPMGKLTLEHHEGATVCALEQYVDGDPERLKRLVEEEISALAVWTDARGGIVGHIKASLETVSGTVFYSSTGKNIAIRKDPTPGRKLKLVAILFMVEDVQLKKQLEQFRDRLESDD